MPNKTDLIYSRPDNVNNTVNFFFGYTSNITNGLWGYLIIAGVFSISYLSLTVFNARRAFAASSYITFVLTVILATFDVVGGYAFTLTALMAVASLLLNRGGENIGR